MKDIESGQIDRLEDMLAKAGNIVVITHMKPDGDALGSSTAMYHYLKSIGKECRIVIPDPNPSNLDFLLDQDTRKDLRIYEAYPISTAAAIKESDLIICMDHNNLRNMRRIIGDDTDGKIKLMLDYTERAGQEVADPWYTGDFDATWCDVTEGCAELLSSI
jgi:nanoRNase/pAp phosphatase (c-di-AMP/oligoRNAs hydrolase)